MKTAISIALALFMTLAASVQAQQSTLDSIATLKQQLKPRPAAYPDIIATSSKSRDGIAELRTAIAQLLRERGKR